MDKKPTAKDVAREAGVSVATVSYIMNNKTGQKISEATRKKVLQIANLLNYRPSHEAVSLATGKNNMIGIIYHLRDDSPTRNLEIMNMVNLLVERFCRMNYSCIIIPFDREAAAKAPNRMLDGIIAIDIPEQVFREMADNCYVPIICMDMIVNDFLFYQIYTDFARLTAEAQTPRKTSVPTQQNASSKSNPTKAADDLYLVTDRYDNEGYNRFLLSCLPEGHVIFSDSKEKTFSSLKDKKIIVNGPNLAQIMSKYTDSGNMTVLSCFGDTLVSSQNLALLHTDAEKKANLAMNIMLNAFEQKFDIKHDFKI